MNKISIIMSTYNGANFLSEQLDSILAQDYPNYELIVRDDGSTDNTIDILKHYQNRMNLHFTKGKNLGYCKSFFTALSYCDKESVYYMFCDQDDIWLPNKITTMISEISTMDYTKPNVVYANSEIVNEKLEHIAYRPLKLKSIQLHHVLFEDISLGCNLIFNQSMANSILEHMPKNCLAHDGWLELVSTGLGTFRYLDTVTMKYRRHSSTTSFANTDFYSILKLRIRRFIVGDYLQKIRQQLLEYIQIYGQQLSIEDQKLVKMYQNETLRDRLQLLFYLHRFRQTIITEIIVRLLILIKKL